MTYPCGALHRKTTPGCIAYATARNAGLPLLFKGADFEQTDIPRA